VHFWAHFEGYRGWSGVGRRLWCFISQLLALRAGCKLSRRDDTTPLFFHLSLSPSTTVVDIFSSPFTISEFSRKCSTVNRSTVSHLAGLDPRSPKWTTISSHSSKTPILKSLPIQPLQRHSSPLPVPIQQTWASFMEAIA
jgi:hypothetical protein